jgi:type I restriction enzyme S subunit
MSISREVSGLLVQVVDLPPDWEVMALGDCLQMIRNGTTAPQVREPPGYPVSRIQTLTDTGIDRTRVHFIRELPEETRQKYQLEADDLLLSHINSEPQIGRTAVYEGDPPGLIHGMNLLRLRADRRFLDPHFLHYLLTWFRMSGVFVRLAGRAVGQSSVNQGKLKAMKIVRPPLGTQLAIVSVLRTIQQTREATQEVISAARELKKSLLRYLFLRGYIPIGGSVQGPQRETEWGLVPEHWVDAKIASFASVRAGHGFPHKYQGQKAGPFPFFKVSDMTLPGNETVMIKANNYVDGEVLRAIKGKPMPPNTVVFPKVGAAVATNKKRILGTEGLVDNNVMGITVEVPETCSPAFLHRWLETVDLVSLSNPGPLPSINATRVKNMTIPLPSPSEQEAIVEVLRVVDGKIAAEEQRKDALDSLFKSLLRDLMSGRLQVPKKLFEQGE